MKLLEPIKSKHVGCLCCPGNLQVLDVETALHNSFGGWMVTKNGDLFYQADHDAEEVKSIEDIEAEIGDDLESDYMAILWLPLRGASYQRQCKNHWVLVEENMGFA